MSENLNNENFYRLSAKALIYNEELKILLCKVSVYGGYFWDLPGGGVDHGEEIKDALIREIDEELGIGVKEISNLPEFSLTAYTEGEPVDYWLANICYKVVPDSYDFKESDENVEYGYFSPNEMFELKAFNNVFVLAKMMISE